MKKLEDKTTALTGRLSGIGKASTHTVNADLKSDKTDKLMEKPENKSTNSVLSKMMYHYLKRKHLKFI